MNGYRWLRHASRGRLRLVVCCGWLLILSSAGAAQEPRVLPAGQVPDDSRLGPLKDLDGYFPFTPSPTVEAWNALRCRAAHRHAHRAGTVADAHKDPGPRRGTRWPGHG